MDDEWREMEEIKLTVNLTITLKIKCYSLHRSHVGILLVLNISFKVKSGIIWFIGMVKHTE